MANKLRCATALVALLIISGCSVSHEQAMINRGCYVGETNNQCTDRIADELKTEWRSANCRYGEADQQCSARLDAEQKEQRAKYLASPEYGASVRAAAEQQADEAECQLVRSQTYQMHDSAHWTFLGLEAAGWANQTYAQCMQMKAAQHAAYDN